MRYSKREKGRTLQHYDLRPEIFKFFLDPYMKYSSGLYLTENDSLAEAQINNMEFIAQQLEISGGERLLDVGCGWGSLLLFLAQRFHCRGWGITPALNQVEYLRERAVEWKLEELIRADAAHVQDFDFPSSCFDAVTFVGSIVHIDDKLGMLQKCYHLLKPKGRIFISESCFRNRKKHKEFSNLPSTNFVRDEVFGWGDMVPLSVYISTLEDTGFSLVALTDLTSHYNRTIQDWISNIKSHYTSIEAIHPGMADKLLRLFEIANAGWGFTTKQYAVVATKKR